MNSPAEGRLLRWRSDGGGIAHDGSVSDGERREERGERERAAGARRRRRAAGRLCDTEPHFLSSRAPTPDSGYRALTRRAFAQHNREKKNPKPLRNHTITVSSRVLSLQSG